MANVEKRTVQHFGEEWTAYNQEDVAEAELKSHFDAYFNVFPWETLPPNPAGFDMGCGSGRWASFVAPRVDRLICVDASEAALEVAKNNLRDRDNCEFAHASVEEAPIHKASMDFGYSLGVLHHIPDTLEGIKACARFLKPGAPLLLYLYYAFDNRPAWFRALWKVSDFLRRGICRLPRAPRLAVCTVIAALVYWPLARLGALLEKLGSPKPDLPLWAYRNTSFYTMRTDALDRFGTPLEQRFTREQIRAMLREAGMENEVFSDAIPYWCVVAYRKSPD